MIKVFIDHSVSFFQAELLQMALHVLTNDLSFFPVVYCIQMKYSYTHILSLTHTCLFVDLKL